MRTFVIGLALAGAAVAVTPVAAQDYRGGYGYNGGYQQTSQRLYQIGDRIDRLAERGAISRQEAYSLRREYTYLLRLDQRLQRGGLNRWERQELNRRTSQLAQRVRYERNDGNWRPGRDGGWDDSRYHDDDRRYDDRRDWRGDDDDDDD